MRKIYIILILISLTACTGQKTQEITIPVSHISDDQPATQSGIVSRQTSNIEAHFSSENSENIDVVTITIPTKYDQEIDFVPQAPDANWDLPYKEACEEASLIMADYGINNKSLDSQTMDQEILKLVEWQKDRFGYYEDTTTDEILSMATEYFGLNARKIENPGINIIKKELSDGNLILAPVAGQEIGNPYFVQPGPIYHVLVIRGYDNKNFITNDPGTRHGEAYKYKYDTIINALHDWNGGDVENGRPYVIVISK